MRAFLLALCSLQLYAAPGVSRYDVTWDSPSRNSLGSMPLGNGETGLNVWVEADGDLLFYIARPDGFREDHRNVKLGRIRVRLSPNPFAAGLPFRQKLELENGRILIDAGKPGAEVQLSLWVDANQPVARLQGGSRQPVAVSVAYEMWRPTSTVRSLAAPAAAGGDLVLDDGADRLLWYHRNASSVWAAKLKEEGLAELVAGKVRDPLLHHTFGALLRGAGFRRSGPAALAADAKTAFDLSIHFLAGQYDAPAQWASALEAQAAQTDRTPAPLAWSRHQQWWTRFWQRSWIHVEGPGITRTISERYAHQRFINACSNRGRYPVMYNGSIFTMDLPAGTPTFFGKLKNDVDADYRSWGDLPFMWQNTRHPYWPMLASGDFDLMRPVFDLCRDSLTVCQARARVWRGHDGLLMPEATLLAGVSRFARKIPQHLVYHRTGMIEMATMMCDYFAYTGDRRFARETLLPWAEAVLTFFELEYPQRDGRGRMVMGPSAAVETYQPATNVVTESAGLALLLDRLMELPADLAGPPRLARWQALRRILPGVSVRTAGGAKLIAVADETAAGREICEVPELYSVWPFRQVTHWKDELLAAARQGFAVRMMSLDGTDDKQSFETGGWLYTAADAAYLALPREAARLVSQNFGDNAPWITGPGIQRTLPPDHPGQPRFAAFWETRMDFIPDQCHGGASVHALQSMLIQSGGGKIYLLPAWPLDWDVAFKLSAPGNTVVEGDYRGGRLRLLKVTPESRRRDVIDMTAVPQRIKTLVSTIVSDRNYLFGLPPMLDGQPALDEAAKQPELSAWLNRFGRTLRGLAGPWKPAAWGGSVSSGDTVYLHVLRREAGPLTLPALGRGILSCSSLTRAKASLRKQDAEAVVIDIQPAAGEPDAIVELKLDGSAEALAREAPYQNSLTREARLTKSAGAVEVDLGRPQTFERAEIRFNLPGVFKQKVPLALEYKDEAGAWQSLWSGTSFSPVWTRRFPPVSARHLRVVTDGAVARLDVFRAGIEE